VFARQEPEDRRFDLWKRDLVRGSESRLTSTGNNLNPVWSADSAYIFFRSTRDGGYKIYQKAADGTELERVVDDTPKIPADASRDYLFTTTSPEDKNGADIWVLPLSGDHTPVKYVATEFQESNPRLSPNGRWLAYQSNASKRQDIYVESFPQKGGKWMISTNGGRMPVWSRDGRELYYYSLDNKIMSVEIKPGAQFEFGTPQVLFEVAIANNSGFEVSNDGRFLVPLAEQDGSGPMEVVLNWPELLKRR
jgi:Tol biopolymer transport system component